jgi:hypothetical protein
MERLQQREAIVDVAVIHADGGIGVDPHGDWPGGLR